LEPELENLLRKFLILFDGNERPSFRHDWLASQWHGSTGVV
jgi:hypothetical protein